MTDCMLSYLSGRCESSEHLWPQSFRRDNSLELVSRAFSADGQCGAGHGGLTCDPKSTVYKVRFFAIWTKKVTNRCIGNLLFCKLYNYRLIVASNTNSTKVLRMVWRYSCSLWNWLPVWLWGTSTRVQSNSTSIRRSMWLQFRRRYL